MYAYFTGLFPHLNISRDLDHPCFSLSVLLSSLMHSNLVNPTVLTGNCLGTHVRDICGSLIDVLPGDRVQLVHGTAKAQVSSLSSSGSVSHTE
jgi:hypothetical protein